MRDTVTRTFVIMLQIRTQLLLPGLVITEYAAILAAYLPLTVKFPAKELLLDITLYSRFPHENQVPNAFFFPLRLFSHDIYLYILDITN